MLAFAPQKNTDGPKMQTKMSTWFLAKKYSIGWIHTIICVSVHILMSGVVILVFGFYK